MTRSVVAWSCGELTGYACQTTCRGRSTPGAANVIVVVGVPGAASTSLALLRVLIAGSVLARNSGPLDPAPKPSADQVVGLARRLVFLEVAGVAEAEADREQRQRQQHQMPTPMSSGGHGRCWMSAAPAVPELLLARL